MMNYTGYPETADIFELLDPLTQGIAKRWKIAAQQVGIFTRGDPLVDVAERISAQFDIQTPLMFRIDSKAIKGALAFIGGLPVLGLSTGLIDHFAREETTAVIGHECAHVADPETPALNQFYDQLKPRLGERLIFYHPRMIAKMWRGEFIADAGSSLVAGKEPMISVIKRSKGRHIWKDTEHPFPWMRARAIRNETYFHHWPQLRAG
jgi:hypothetical protein